MKKKYIFIGAAVLIVILAAVIVIICIGGNKSHDSKNTPAPTTEPTASPTPMVTAEPGKVQENIGNIVIPGYNIIELKISGGKATVELTNPKENENMYEISFTLKINGQDENVFTTEFIKAGETITSVDVSADVEKGTYDAVLLAEPRRVADGELTNNCEMNVKLNVK